MINNLSSILHSQYASLVQLAEQVSLKHFGMGSNPIWGANFHISGQDIRSACSVGSSPTLTTNCPSSLTAKTEWLIIPVDGGSIPSLGTIFASVTQLVQAKGKTGYVQSIHNSREGGCGEQKVCLSESGDRSSLSEYRLYKSEVWGSSPHGGANLRT